MHRYKKSLEIGMGGGVWMLKKRASRWHLRLWPRPVRGLGGSVLERAQVRGARAHRVRGLPAQLSPSPVRKPRPPRRGRGVRGPRSCGSRHSETCESVQTLPLSTLTPTII